MWTVSPMLSATFFLAFAGYSVSAAHVTTATSAAHVTTRSPFAAKALATVSKHALVKENKCAPSGASSKQRRQTLVFLDKSHFFFL